MDKRIHKLADPTGEGFDELVNERMGEMPTYESAYKAVEAEHIKKLGYRRYSNYNSYRNSRQKRLSSKKCN